MLNHSRRFSCSVQDIFTIAKPEEILAKQGTSSACIIDFMSITERIKELRERKGWNQSELARRVGVKPQAVQLWEKQGGTAPKRARLEKVAEVLGVSVTDLLANRDEKFPPMRDDVRKLIDRLIDAGSSNILAQDDIQTLNKMLSHMISSSMHDHPMQRESDWLVGGPSATRQEKKNEKTPRN